MNKHTLKIFLICVTLLLVAATQPVLGYDWSTFQNDNYNSGITDKAGPISNNGSYAFAVFTKSSGMSGIDTTPVVAGDVVYTAAQGKAFAFNKTTGDEIWNTSLAGGFVLATPVIADGKIFIGTNNGVIAAYDISNGTEAWINSTGLGGEKAQVNTPIVYDSGNIYFGTWFSSGDPGSYYCVNATDGSFVWERACTSNAGYYWAGACVVGDYLVYGGDDGNLVSVNKYTGTTVEDVGTVTIFSSGTGNIRSSMSYDQSTGRLYFASGSKCYYVGFDSSNGTFVKSVKGTGSMSGDSTSTPAVYNDRVYVGCGGSLYCLDADSLQIIWSYTVGAKVQSSPAISTYYDDGDGEIYIYFTTNDHSSGMYCLKDMPGNTEAILQFEFFPPSSMKQYSLQGAAISDGMVYYGNDAGYLFALDDPDICFTANTTYGSVPLTVQFTDLSAGATEWQWDFDNDGNVDSTEQNPVYTYSAAGNYSVRLTINKSTGSVQELKTDYITVVEAKPLEDYLTYTSDGSSITITGYTGPAGDLVIPDEIDGLPVTKIAERVFQGTPLTSVVIPDSVTNIGLYQFQNCEDLISIYTGGVPSISTNNIRNCPSLETITVGHRLSSITSYSIRDCPSLEAMVFEAEGDAPSASGNWNYNCPNLVVYYCENATGFTTPKWGGKPCYPIGSPTADFSTDGIFGSAPFTVKFTYTGVGANTLNWYFDGDATVDSNARNPGYTYDTPGTYSATLYVSNPWGSDSELKTNYITVVEARTDGWAYTSDGTSVTVTGYSGPDSDVTIPAEIDGLPVTTIGTSACKALTNLTSVTIPDSVNTIDASAFYGCINLTSVTIPDSVNTIGSSAFYGCTGMDSLTIGNGVTTIGSSALYGCTGLTSVTIPNSVTTIDDSAFYGCTNLTVMMFNGNAPTTVGSNWASGTNLVAYYSEGATNFTTPEWNEVPCYPALAAVTAEFTSNIVYGSAPLTVQFTYTGVGANALVWDFDNNGTVDSTARNPGYTYDAPGTYSVSLNVSNPWGSDSEVKTDYITIAETVDNFTYTSDGTSVTITGYTGSGGDVVIPGTIGGLPVTTIASSAFKSNTALTSVIIPDSVTTIGGSAFYGCTSLTSVTIGNNVTTIDTYAFYGCTALTSVVIPDSVTSIGERAFYGCSALSSATIGNGVTSIGKYMFYQCTNLASATIGNNVTTIGDSAFRYCTALTSVTIPDSVTSIGSYAFQDCGLTSLTIPNSVISIGDYTFRDTGLISADIPDSVTSIGSGAFRGCTALTSVTIPDSVTSIDGSVFRDCTALTSVTIPDSITEIGKYAFRDCTTLTSVTVGNNVTTIGDYAFRDCTALTSVMFTGNAPSSVSSSWASGSTSLTAYYYEGATGFTTPTWNGVACYPLTTAAPVADFEADVTSGIGPLIVKFADRSTGSPTAWAWDFDNDGTIDSTEQTPEYTYISPGNYTVTLTVNNTEGSDAVIKEDYITVLEVPTSSSADEDTWYQFRKTAEHTGYTTSDAPDTNTLLWKSARLTDEFTLVPSSSVAVADGKVFANAIIGPVDEEGTPGEGTIGQLVAFSMYDGHKYWNTTIAVPEWGSWSSPAYDNGFVFTSTGANTTCINATTGAIEWAFTNPSGRASCNGGPVIAEGKVLCSDWDGLHYYCLDETTGTEMWNYTVDGSDSYTQGTPAVSNGTIILTSWNDIYCLDMDGNLLWTKPNPSSSGSICGSPSIEGDMFYLTTYDFGSDYKPALFAFDLENGTEIWNATIQRTDSTPAIADGYLYVCGGCTGYSESQTYCFDALNGTLIWSTPKEDQGIGDWTCSIAVADGKVFVGKSAGSSFGHAGLYALDAATGTEIWHSDSAGDSPAIADDTVFSIGRDQEGVAYLYAFKDEESGMPVADFSADITSGVTPLTINFTDQSTGTPTSWFWEFGDGGNSTEQNPSHTYNAAGNYTVNLTVENAAGTDFELKTDYIEISEASGSTVNLYFDPESSSVAENESTKINLVASNFPAGLSGYNLTVALDDPNVAEIVDIEYPTWALITENSTLPGTSIYMKTVDLEDAVKADSADVVLATLTVSGKEKGSANLSIGVKRLEEDSGDSIEPALLAGKIEVTLLSPLPDQEYTPKDLDGDGLYEDLTGNGEFSFVDIVAYFHNMDWIEANMQVEYFDFNGNGRIDFDDVVDMFAMI
ncbi:Chitin binding protein [Methanosarcina siciliae HI350]|uniref:Chitin binding protein n=1 Tax=Methanosarcina siciliae HI350 TaxID=1434119 RepID=A0A0E3LA52_9EURY|nr:leucine-rich repeat protein [Methanosarcina siciliae]AKB31416.1 Chitin binding protein [Methanosarcina siciliae HI350]